MSVEVNNSVFRPLEEGQIRLILLQPGTRTEPLRCQVNIATLKDRPHYSALSYAWGDPERTKTLTLNGISIQVTKNLHIALQYLRHESETITLWVDGLCICQEDDAEKSRQVSMMGDIFRGARLTWIWLGEASPEDDAVMEYLVTNGKQTDTRDPAELAIRSLQLFFGRPWFQRLWILQEALLSQNPIVKYGDKQIGFEHVVRLSTDLIFKNLGNSRGDPFVWCYLRGCLHEWDRLKDHLSNGGWALVYAMPMTEQLKCTLFKDRVFALLGLSTELDRKSIQPDYAKPLAEILIDICVHLISSSENPLAALHYMGIRGNSELPSWARDWSKPKEVDWHFWRPSGGAQERWHFLQKTQSQIGYDWLDVEAGNQAWRMEATKTTTDVARFSSNLRILALKGMSVDTVESVHSASTFDDRTSWKDVCESWKTLATENAKAYPSQEACFDAFCKTLCYGRYRDAQGKLMTNCGEAYESWICGEGKSDSGDLNDGVRCALNDYEFRTERYRVGRSFIITKKGFVGLAPEATRTGDLVCFFKGSLDPFILRSKGDMYEFIGETLITGMMEGEWVEGAEVGDITEYWIA